MHTKDAVIERGWRLTGCQPLKLKFGEIDKNFYSSESKRKSGYKCYTAYTYCLLS